MILTLLSVVPPVREGGEGRAEMVVRVEAEDHSWVWLYMVLQLEEGDCPISSNNFVIRYGHSTCSTEHTGKTIREPLHSCCRRGEHRRLGGSH